MALFKKDKEISDIPLQMIFPNPDQPRKFIDPEGIRSLADSINENGLINPITLKKIDKNEYFIICGERRYLAFKLLERETIPAIIKNPDDIKLSSLALVENTQRAALSFLEEAMAIKEFLSEQNISQGECAKLLGISQASVANKLRILRLPTEVLKMLSEAGFTERHARALLTIEKSPNLMKIAKKAVEEGMTVRQIEKLCLKENNKKTNQPTIIIKDVRAFTSSIDNAVKLIKKCGCNVTSSSKEDENDIIYTIVIPKKSCRPNAI